MTDQKIPAESPINVRAEVLKAKQLAAAALPLLVERVAAEAVGSDDVEVLGKAMERLAKLAGAMDDKGASTKPIIHFTISSAGANVQVTGRAAPTPAQEVQEVEDAVEVLTDKKPAALPKIVPPTLPPPDPHTTSELDLMTPTIELPAGLADVQILGMDDE